MSSRDKVLHRLRRSLGVSGEDGDRRAAVAARLAEAPKGVIPARGHLDPEGRIALFCERATKAAAVVERVPDMPAAAEAIAAILRGANLPAQVRTGDDPRLSGVPLSALGLEVATGASDGNDPVSVSFADGAVAETGTLILTSGPTNPTTLNFLPDRHIVLVNAGDIGPDLETAIAGLRTRFGKGTMPRTVNMVTGPSRSGDIEQTLILGAHGPRTLNIVVVG